VIGDLLDASDRVGDQVVVALDQHSGLRAPEQVVVQAKLDEAALHQGCVVGPGHVHVRKDNILDVTIRIDADRFSSRQDLGELVMRVVGF